MKGIKNLHLQFTIMETKRYIKNHYENQLCIGQEIIVISDKLVNEKS